MAALNSRVTRKSVHISLNFAQNEEKLSDIKLLEIAAEYMERIGFGNQPWLAYRHLDAGHPHLHLVSLKVRPDGSRIDMQNIGRNQSETARKAIENTYGLTPAENQGQLHSYRPDPVSAGRLHYGQRPTKQAIGNVLQFVLQKYRFTSLAELNAVLGLYNVKADRGKATSRTYVSGGLMYRALGPSGEPLGVPQKASTFHFAPTLGKLEQLFKNSEAHAMKGQMHTRAAVDAVYLRDRPKNLSALMELLRPAGIDLVLRVATTGQVYGVTFVDHTNYCIFNGSTLGRKYSAKSLSDRCNENLRDSALGQQPSAAIGTKHPAGGEASLQTHSSHSRPSEGTTPNIVNQLLNPESIQEYTSGEFKKQKKRKKRR
ncbi:relaxase/mobilization nuclease domain-containing protein [Flavobacterium psychrotrophum]|uniref:relaxase/mobilization nuclease domain-containing protein n=1 Tax=Flavobacterium psychrotrophum TaxID=2294119 RepID=UPI001F0926D0|nr:relaxase/mobilization nuclease domain-containing protein [Flavobacterium psychrotrophum]